ncbi:hypothetical protein cypCar_00030707, partial [Cyprinus carpio]
IDLDPMLDDSVMFAKRLRNIGQPVTLCAVDDLPHGFLSLSQLSRETREAANICMERIRDVFTMKDPPPEMRMHRKLERTNQKPSATKRDHTQLSQVTVQEKEEEEEEEEEGGGASDWVFLTRFCFLTDFGRLNFKFRYPKASLKTCI